MVSPVILESGDKRTLSVFDVENIVFSFHNGTSILHSPLSPLNEFTLEFTLWTLLVVGRLIAVLWSSKHPWFLMTQQKEAALH